MDQEVSSLVERRQILRAVAENLASSLDPSDREEFLQRTGNMINVACPPPGRTHMKMYLKLNSIK
jgi:hypothetical protein